jgi:hypothetical protein
MSLIHEIARRNTKKARLSFTLLRVPLWMIFEEVDRA